MQPGWWTRQTEKGGACDHTTLSTMRTGRPRQILGRPWLVRGNDEAAAARVRVLAPVSFFSRLCLSVLTFYLATPAPQPSVRCDERSIVRQGSGDDKTVGGVAVQIFKFNRE